ncbi:flagellar hook-length control protein FliK [Stenotrophomonas sp. TWI819]|uniref:flagellar hook-length control protein FliK n=1 Tax=Stenotrophomonas sp. TWI819 TaxID=3136800 RepID=UPI003208FA3C
MTPSALLGGTAPAPSSTAGASGSRPDASGGSDRREFDAMLKPGRDAARPEASSKPAGRREAPAGKDAATPDTGKDTAPRPGSASSKDTAETPATTDTSAAPPATADKPVAEAADDDAAWPPFGLAGLALNGLPVPVPVPVAPAPLGTATGAAPTTAGLPTLATATADTTAPAAGPLAPAAPAASGIALPALAADAAPADAVPLLKTFTEALSAAASDGPDAPATPVLHALQSIVDAKPAAATPFTGSPTATPQLGAGDFDDAVGARVSWLADQKIGHAHIKITPNDLGPIDVRLHLDGDKVHATFTSAHADVRHALESSLPRLRDMLGEQGFQLGQADVGQQHTAQDGGRGEGTRTGTGDDGEPLMAETTLSPSQLIRQRGLVDAYA